MVWILVLEFSLVPLPGLICLLFMYVLLICTKPFFQSGIFLNNFCWLFFKIVFSKHYNSWYISFQNRLNGNEVASFYDQNHESNHKNSMVGQSTLINLKIGDKVQVSRLCYINPNWHEAGRIFELDFVSWIFIKNFQTFLEVKIKINRDYLTKLIESYKNCS